MSLLPEQTIHYLVTLLHVRVFLYECVNVNLENRSDGFAVGGGPVNKTKTIGIAGLYEVYVVIAEDVRHNVVFRLPVVYAVGRQCAHSILNVG